MLSLFAPRSIRGVDVDNIEDWLAEDNGGGGMFSFVSSLDVETMSHTPPPCRRFLSEGFKDNKLGRWILAFKSGFSFTTSVRTFITFTHWSNFSDISVF